MSKTDVSAQNAGFKNRFSDDQMAENKISARNSFFEVNNPRKIDDFSQLLQLSLFLYRCAPNLYCICCVNFIWFSLRIIENRFIHTFVLTFTLFYKII